MGIRIVSRVVGGFVSAMLLLGCGSGVVADPAITLPSYNSAPMTPLISSVYHAYGDSITRGYELAEASQAYPSLLAVDEGLTLHSYARTGDQACDVPTQQIFPAGDNPDTPYPLYTMLIGTNDADSKGSGAYEAVYKECLQASISWLGVPAGDKVLATNRSVVTSGPGAIDKAGGWNAWRTTTQGASISFPVKLLSAGTIYLWPRIIDGDGGSFSYALDGQVVGMADTTTSPSISTQNGSNNSLGFVRVSGVAAGGHVVTFTQTSSTGTMQIVGVGSTGIGSLATAELPVVIVGDVPLQKVRSAGPCSENPGICEAYTADAGESINAFVADGLDVQFAENHAYMKGTSAEMVDDLHPNALGHQELRSAFEARIVK